MWWHYYPAFQSCSKVQSLKVGLFLSQTAYCSSFFASLASLNVTWDQKDLSTCIKKHTKFWLDCSDCIYFLLETWLLTIENWRLVSPQDPKQFLYLKSQQSLCSWYSAHLTSILSNLKPEKTKASDCSLGNLGEKIQTMSISFRLFKNVKTQLK